ncbi:MAG: glycosyltransferase family 4 protein [Planctomycetota bacterium]|nr:glycosyltransferase family 4 protein [Planctomycetota bacterium]
MIICYVHPPEVAPAGVMVRELADDLAADGHLVTVQTGWPNHPRGRIFDGYKARWRFVGRDGQHRLMRVGHAIAPKSSPLRRLWVYLTFAISSFLNGLTLGRHDVVVCLSTPLFGVWAAWALAKLWRGRFVNIIFDLWPEAIRNAGLIGENFLYRLTRRIDTLNCRCSNAITTLGEGLKAEITARRIDPNRVEVIPFWVDTEKIHPLPRDNPWRQECGIGTDTFVALFAGTIGYVSGAQILAETAACLKDRSDILILIVGEGVARDELEQLSKKRNMSNIRFLPFQPAERLAEVQSTADVGLLTLLPESGTSSVPSKVLGYMAAGRAVIASCPETTDTANLLREGGFGIVTPTQDPQALADAIRTLADDRKRCEALGAKARDYLLKHFSRQVVVEKYKKVILGDKYSQ